jgi:hypothetical protein
VAEHWGEALSSERYALSMHWDLREAHLQPRAPQRVNRRLPLSGRQVPLAKAPGGSLAARWNRHEKAGLPKAARHPCVFCLETKFGFPPWSRTKIARALIVP